MPASKLRETPQIDCVAATCRSCHPAQSIDFGTLLQKIEQEHSLHLDMFFPPRWAACQAAQRLGTGLLFPTELVNFGRRPVGRVWDFLPVLLYTIWSRLLLFLFFTLLATAPQWDLLLGRPTAPGRSESAANCVLPDLQHPILFASA